MFEKGNLVSYNDSVYHVLVSYSKYVLLRSAKDTTELFVESRKCKPLKLDENWLNLLGLTLGKGIINIHTGEEWIIKQTTNKIYYLTRELGENPVFGLLHVHKLQNMFYKLTTSNLNLNESTSH